MPPYHVHIWDACSSKKSATDCYNIENTSSSTIVINRLEREREGEGREKNMKMKEGILVLYVYDSWDHPVGHRLDRP
jgi:hypothetical protein